jgi:hypothetical protein
MKKLTKALILSQWAADPATMTRLEQIVLLTQRTDLIKQLMLIEDGFEGQLRIQIKVICDKHNIPYVPPRGRTGDTKNPKQFYGRVRFDISVLLGLFLSSNDGGVVSSKEGRLLSTDVLDRLIFAYHRYLQLHRVTSAQATVSFELFVKSWQAVQMGEAVMANCTNCGSTYVNFRSAMQHQCPVCTSLNLAMLQRPAVIRRSSQDDFGQPIGQKIRNS